MLAVIEGLEQGLSVCKRLRVGLILCAMNHCDPLQYHEENIETIHMAK